MYDADAIEAINFEQLVTATDRLLLRGGRVSKRRPSVPSLVQRVPVQAFARGSEPRLEPTVATRTAARSARSQAFASTVVIPVLLGVAVGLVAML